MRPTLIVLAKAPRMGRVKRRLARDFGEAAALCFYRSCLAGTLRRLGRDPRWTKILAVAPDRAISGWPRPWQAVPQGAGDLGRRMLRQLRAAGPGPAVLIGGDIPGIDPGAVARALDRLRRADVVFGPSDDGGYWLIGFRRPPPDEDALSGVRWSTEHAMADSIAALRRKAGLRVALADTIADVDDLAALRRWRSRRR